MALYYCLGSVTNETDRFNASIKLEANDRNHALRLARQELHYKYPKSEVVMTSAVNIGRGAQSGNQGFGR
jgi:hypothetical protein